VSDIRVGFAVGMIAGLWTGFAAAAVIWMSPPVAGAVTLTGTAVAGVLERERRQND
jgi:hypothetical protein